MLLSHLLAGTGAVAIETREETRCLTEALQELRGRYRESAVIVAPNGPVLALRLVDSHGRETLVRDKEPLIRPAQGQLGLQAALAWAAAGPGRVLFVLDWHVLVNAPGHWRLLIDALSGLRQPTACSEGDPASLAVFVAPSFNLEPHNPLKGQLPILPFAPPSREALRIVASGISELPANGEGEAVVDALCGLSADTAEQVCAETIARGDGWDVESLLSGKRQALKDSGITLLPTVDRIGGMGGLMSFMEHEMVPWLRDQQLAEQRLLIYGTMGCGKSLFARRLGGRLNCLVGQSSIASLKAAFVGQSEGNLRRMLRVADEMGRHAPFILLIDEVDTIASNGNDGGTSSGMFQILLTTLNDWLSTGCNQVIVIATGNDLEKLDPALESRFTSRWFADLPNSSERREIAAIHFGQFGCTNVDHASRLVASLTDGFSGREIGMDICRSAARLSRRQLDDDSVRLAVGRTTPVSRTQPEKLERMRQAASTLRKANSEDDHSGDPSPSRRVMG